MPFQESAESLKSKAHLSGVKTPVLVGLTALSLCVIALAGVGLLRVATSEGLVVVTAEEASDESEGEDAEAEVVDGDAEEEVVSTVFVYVSGAVVSPCVCELPEGSRVVDAIEAAGGFAEDAATDALNLARVLEDGEQIDVPTLEEQEAAEEAGITLSTSSTDETSDSSSEGLININTATAEELETLPGIGEVTAANIIADREANGPFESIEDITRVSGIGDKKFEAIADLICVD